MSLGGYKFAGKYCEKGSLTDVQWALLVHKTRLASFMASNALSNAGWSFDQTGGDIAFGTYGNVIYSLDSVGNNYVSFMKHGTDSPTYIAVITAFYWGASSQSNVGKIDGPWQLRYGNEQFIGASNSLFHRLSRTQLTALNLFSSISGATPLIPLGFVMSTATGYSGMTPSRSYSFPSQSSFYAGYAIKEARVIAFASKSVTQKAIHVSALGIGARTNIIPSSNTNDTFATSFFGAYFGSSGATSYGDCVDIDAEDSDSYQYGATIILDSSGNVQLATVGCPGFSQFVQTVSPQDYPFGSVFFVSANATGRNSIYAGSALIDFIASNVSPSKQTNRMQAYAGGNYLFVATENYTQSFPYGKFAFTSYQTILSSAVNGYPALYVGWDPSNPDITQASAWQLYDGT